MALTDEPEAAECHQRELELAGPRAGPDARGLPGVAGGEDDARRDRAAASALECLSDARPSTLVVSVVSASRLFRTNLNRGRFDQYLAATGADYVVRVKSAGMASELRGVLLGLRLAPGGPVDTIDLRYRLDFERNGQESETIYVGQFGDILCNGVRLRPTKDDAWLRRFWGLVRDDVVK